MGDVVVLPPHIGILLTTAPPPLPDYLDVEAWRAATQMHLPGLPGTKRTGLSQLTVRRHLSPVDIYCYLKARFGGPNGFITRMGFINTETSDNLVHWDYGLVAGACHIHIIGKSREVQFIVNDTLSDADWWNLIQRIKGDYKRVSKEKSAVLRSLELWNIFPNKFAHLAETCAELHAHILRHMKGFETYKGPAANAEQKSVLERMHRRARRLYGACMQLTLLTPVMAEAFINMLILMLCRREVRENERHFDAFMRAGIDVKLYDLTYKCYGFRKRVDKIGSLGNFQAIMNRRNTNIHGNPEPTRECIAKVYFDGKIPLYKEGGDIIGKFMEERKAHINPVKTIRDYEDTHTFLIDVVACLESKLAARVWQVLEEFYPGYDERRRIVGKLLPKNMAIMYGAGVRYDDQLQMPSASE